MAFLTYVFIFLVFLRLNMFCFCLILVKLAHLWSFFFSGPKQTSFPLPEFIIAAGFFTVLILEKTVMHFRERRGAGEERAPLLSGNRNGHGHGAVTTPDLEDSAHHVHVDFQAHSPFRSFMLFLSLSLHSVFEGLAIGLQSTDSKVRRRWFFYFILFCFLFCSFHTSLSHWRFNPTRS